MANHTIPQRRKCDNCVQEAFSKLEVAFNNLIGSFSYQKWLVRVLIAAILVGGFFDAISSTAMSTKNAEQDVKLAIYETMINDLIKHMEKKEIRDEKIIATLDVIKDKI